MGELTYTDRGITWKHGGETLLIEPWGENSLRVRARVMGEILDTDFALLPPAETDPVIGENTITNGKLKAILSVDGNTCRVSFYDRSGKLLLQEHHDGGAAMKLRARHFKPITHGDHSLTLTFESDENEKLYGMGQYQQEIFDVKSCSFELAQRNSQNTIPFVLSSKGYGFFWHNPAIGSAVFSKNRTEWRAESTKQMDYWITAGDTPAEIVEAYANATGRPPMMPEYGLGFWQCKLRYYNQEQLLNVAREYKRRGIPLDVIVCDFFHWPKTGDYRFDEAFFPDVPAMTAELKEMGVELMVSVWPLIDYYSESYKEMLGKNMLVATERGNNMQVRFASLIGTFYDATNPDARRYVWEKCKKNYYDKGVKIFWLDAAEPEFNVYDFDNFRYYLGPNTQIGNIYPQMYSRGFYEGMTAEGQEAPVNLVRASWAGSQRYGALVWSGDIKSSYEDFRKQLCAGLHMGLSGIPWWTTDIGGFYGGDGSDEGFRRLLVRWFQYGAFCPVMRLHGFRSPASDLFDANGNPAFETGADNEVWSFGEEAYEIMVKYINLREAMRPYTRGLMRQAHEHGSPVIRAMFYEFPDDAACWDIKDQYMYGPDVLVAPIVYEDMYERPVYLPKGASWTDANSGKMYAGGQTVTVPAPLDVIPVFFRDGKKVF